MNPAVRADGEPALEGVWAALARGTSRARVRHTVVFCAKGHVLLEVYRTPSGPYMLYRGVGRRDASAPDRGRLVALMHWLAEPLRVGEVITSCTCSSVTAFDLDLDLDLGPRRFIVTYDGDLDNA